LGLVAVKADSYSVFEIVRQFDQLRFGQRNNHGGATSSRSVRASVFQLLTFPGRSFHRMIPLCVLMWVPLAAGQVAPSAYNPTSSVDLYGNAQPTFLDRRSVGIFQNAVQQSRLGLYQEIGRRRYQRGGYSPFALPGDPRRSVFDDDDSLLTTLLGRAAASTLPSGARSPDDFWSPSRRKAFDAYGGFDRRLPIWEPGTLSAVLSRRQALMTATGLNAPVYRALRETTVSPTFVAGALPGPPQRVGEPPDQVAPTLAQRLQSNVDQAYRDCANRAWRSFREGNYRMAIRLFQAASAMKPSDLESRLGELMVNLSLGAMRSALEVMESIMRRTQNPFDLLLDVTVRFRDRQEALRVRLEAQLFSSASGQTNSRALYALVLWYLGESEEAIAIAEAVRRDAPNSRYAEWPDMMRKTLISGDRLMPSARP